MKKKLREKKLFHKKTGRKDDYVYFKVSDEHESVLDLRDILKINERLRADVQRAMGRNHHRDEETIRREFVWRVLPTASFSSRDS